MPRVSPAHKDAVRRRIMDAALVCLGRNGYRNVTTREVLAEAGLSTGTFYNYFPTKDHLYEALAAELLAGERARLADGVARGDDLGAALMRFLADHVLGAGIISTPRPWWSCSTWCGTASVDARPPVRCRRPTSGSAGPCSRCCGAASSPPSPPRLGRLASTSDGAGPSRTARAGQAAGTSTWAISAARDRSSRTRSSRGKGSTSTKKP